MVALVLFLMIAIGLPQAAAQTTAARPPTRDRLLTDVKSWAYQLQNVDPTEIARSAFDLVVVDYSRNGHDAGRFTKEDVQAMQRKPDGSRRLVLAYVSIGEAEDYRFYWNPKWVEPAPLKIVSSTQDVGAPTATTVSPPATVRIPRLVAPGWLGRENERWHGNYHVRFWYDGWQDIMIYDTRSYLARVDEAGFDGVYLDRVDAFYSIEGDRDDAARRMVDLVTDFATKARSRQAEFLIVAQNGEELLRNPKYMAAINGIAKEDLMFGGDGDGTPNPAPRAAATTAQLQDAKAAGKTVLVIEYIGQDKRSAARSALLTQGFLPYFGPRKLDRLDGQ